MMERNREEPALLRPSTLITDSKSGGFGSGAARLAVYRCGENSPVRAGLAAGEGHQEGLRRTGDGVAGTQSGPYFVERTTVNTGTIWLRFLPEVGNRPTWVG